jgi:hypothetical protein
MTLPKDQQIALRKQLVAVPDAVAIGIVKAHHDDPVHGCKCGQEHDWMQLVQSARAHDAQETAAGR